jgi:hypothetical protein
MPLTPEAVYRALRAKQGNPLQDDREMEERCEP